LSHLYLYIIVDKFVINSCGCYQLMRLLSTKVNDQGSQVRQGSRVRIRYSPKYAQRRCPHTCIIRTVANYPASSRVLVQYDRYNTIGYGGVSRTRRGLGYSLLLISLLSTRRTSRRVDNKLINNQTPCQSGRIAYQQVFRFIGFSIAQIFGYD